MDWSRTTAGEWRARTPGGRTLRVQSWFSMRDGWIYRLDLDGVTLGECPTLDEAQSMARAWWR